MRTSYGDLALQHTLRAEYGGVGYLCCAQAVVVGAVAESGEACACRGSSTPSSTVLIGVGMSLRGPSMSVSMGLGCDSDDVRAGDAGSSVGGGVGCCAGALMAASSLNASRECGDA
jgi:hypothetical protein